MDRDELNRYRIRRILWLAIPLAVVVGGGWLMSLLISLTID